MNNLIFLDERLKVDKLSDSDLFEKLNFIQQKISFLYSQELSHLEKKKSNAIIKDLEDYKKFSEKYNFIKSLTPEVWMNNWETYLTIKHEIEKRNLDIIPSASKVI